MRVLELLPGASTRTIRPRPFIARLKGQYSSFSLFHRPYKKNGRIKGKTKITSLKKITLTAYRSTERKSGADNVAITSRILWPLKPFRRGKEKYASVIFRDLLQPPQIEEARSVRRERRGGGEARRDAIIVIRGLTLARPVGWHFRISRQVDRARGHAPNRFWIATP